MEGFGGNDHSINFDQTFGTKANIYGGQDVMSNGQTVATSKQSFIHGGHDTYINGKMVTSTSHGLTGETDIHNSSGQEIGEIRNGLHGSDKELYVNHEHVATALTDVNGNQKIMSLEDPLSKAHEYALIELILSN